MQIFTLTDEMRKDITTIRSPLVVIGAIDTRCLSGLLIITA